MENIVMMIEQHQQQIMDTPEIESLVYLINRSLAGLSSRLQVSEKRQMIHFCTLTNPMGQPIVKWQSHLCKMKTVLAHSQGT